MVRTNNWGPNNTLVQGGNLTFCVSNGLGDSGLSILQDTTFEAMRIDSSGNVIIGEFTGANLTVFRKLLLPNGDCAEHFDAQDPELPEPGAVVVIDKEGALRESWQAYDKKVAGGVSGAGEYRPALLLDYGPSEEGRIPVALMGKV
jgi:hypothetical protein